MTLLALIVSLWGAREAYVPSYFANGQWGLSYLNVVQNQPLMQTTYPALAYGLYVAPPVLLAWFIQARDGWAMMLLATLLAIVVLVACLDYRKVEAALIPFLSRWSNREWQSAYEQGSHHFDYGKMVSPAQLLNQTITQYWLKVNRTLFAPLFWYFIFGLAGVVLYLLTRLLFRPSEDGQASSAPAWKKLGVEFLYSLDAVPARAIALTIAALCFNGKVVAVAFRRFRATDREPEVILKLAVKIGLNFEELPEDEEGIAVEGARRLQVVQDLRSNVFVFWLVVIAVITIIA